MGGWQAEKADGSGEYPISSKEFPIAKRTATADPSTELPSTTLRVFDRSHTRPRAEAVPIDPPVCSFRLVVPPVFRKLAFTECMQDLNNGAGHGEDVT